jgi:HEPN domain-containing protein
MIKNKTLDRLIETIVQDCKPAKIFLVSHFEREDAYSHPFLDVKNGRHRIAKYDLLVLVNSEQNYEALAAFIENRTAIVAQVRAMVYPIDGFHQALAQGVPFLKALVTSNSLVFEAKPNEQVVPDRAELKDWPGLASKANVKALANAEEFLAAAHIHRVRRANEIAAFNLQQCAAQLYMAALLKATGLRFVSDDIRRLQGYSYWYSAEMREILSYYMNTKFHLGDQLQAAFEHARYNENYEVSTELLDAYINEIRKLFDVTLQMIKN